MIFRKQGKLIEICRTHYKTDEMYYNEIYKLQKDYSVANTINFVLTSTIPINKNTTPINTIQNLLLKNHSI